MNMCSILILSAVLSLSLCQTIPNTTQSDNGIPLGFLRQTGMLGDMQSKEAWVRRYMGDLPTGVGSSPETRLYLDPNSPLTKIGPMDGNAYANNNNGEAELMGIIREQAECEPHEQVVELPVPASNVIMYPSCIKVKRCGGCCHHPSLACRPTANGVDRLNFVVTKYVYNGVSMHAVTEVDNIGVDVHTSCECGCKILASDCTDNQEYDDWDCRCKCKNEHLADTCPDHKMWDSSLCGCRCIEVAKCGSGYRFNINTCGCDPIVENANIGVVVDGNATPQTQADTKVEKVEEDPCSHLKCRRRYTAVLTASGLCRCRYNRQNRG